MERVAVVACTGNSPEGEREGICPSAVMSCRGQEQIRVRVWYFVRRAGEPWQAAGSACAGPGQAGPMSSPVVVTEADFRRLPLPAGVVHVQPGSGRTLVNVPTNVYVVAAETVIPTSVLGQPVRVRAVPVQYRWRFGDGGGLTTEDPGAPYPDLRTTHTYLSPGPARIGLTTVYRGEYSVAGGPWLPVDGTAEVVTPDVGLTVVAARAELVDDVLPST